MITHRPMVRFAGQARLLDRAVRVFSPTSECSSHSLLCAFNISDRSLNSLSQGPRINGVRGLENLESSFCHHTDAAAAANFNILPQIFRNLSAVSCRRFIHSSTQKDFERERNFRPMNFVRGIIERGGMNGTGGSQPGSYVVEHNPDIVHIKLIRNNCFVTVTDSKGNKKLGASSGCLSEMKGGPKLSRYAAEATAEHVGRLARNMGLKSVVMKVNGFTFFKKKKQAILSFKEGYTYSRGDQNPVVYIEDTTRKPHNGCRLRKRRRV